MWIDRDSYTSHINEAEKLIKMRRLIDKIQIVLESHVVEATDFLDPYERKLARSILNRFEDIDYMEYGGYEDAERKIITIFPNYLLKDQIPKNITVLKIEGSLESQNHRDYLGALLNLGIIREKIGDILVYKDRGLIIVKSEIDDYIQYNFQKVGNVNIKVNPYLEEIIKPEMEFKEIKGFLTSLRLDVVVSSAYNLSRKESISIVKSNSVKVNWEPVNKASTELGPKDVISVKGHGRFILQEVTGTSKKGRLVCIIRILI